MTTAPRTHRVILIALIGTALLARLAYVLQRDSLFDDVYITLRYSFHLLHGDGMVYNAGERVYGASSPLYTFLLAGIAFLSSRDVLPQILPWLGTVSLIAFVLLFWRFLPLDLPGRMVMTIGLLSYPRIFYASLGGMEECLLILLMGLSVVAHLRGRRLLLGVICGLLFIAKIDTLIWIACIILLEASSEKKVPWKVLSIVLLVSVPWMIYSFAQFGSVIPHTVEAKRAAYIGSGGSELLDVVLFAIPRAYAGNPIVILFYAIGVYGTLTVAVYRSIKRKEYLFLLFPLYCLAYTAMLLSSGTSSALWDRWTVPHWGMFLVTSGYVLNLLFQPSDPGSRSSPRPAVLLALLVFYLGGLSASFLYPVRMSPDPKSSLEVGEWLRDHSTPNQSVFLEPIGLIGFTSNLYVHDFIGLVSPQVTIARTAAQFSNRWYSEYLRTSMPTYIVLREREVKEGEFMYGGYRDGIFSPTEAEWFTDKYQLVFTSTQGQPAERLVVYARSDLSQRRKVTAETDAIGMTNEEKAEERMGA